MRLKGWMITGGIIVMVVVSGALGYATTWVGSDTAQTSDRVASALALDAMQGRGMMAMHDTSAMQAMHDRMPSALQERCDALHDSMLSEGTDMMRMMGSTMPGQTMAGSMASHHPDQGTS